MARGKRDFQESGTVLHKHRDPVAGLYAFRDKKRRQPFDAAQKRRVSDLAAIMDQRYPVGRAACVVGDEGAEIDHGGALIMPRGYLSRNPSTKALARVVS
jgi:hypothetical protein